MNRPAYTLVNDSNVDWNQSLPEVAKFAQQHGLQQVDLDYYSLDDATPRVPQSRLWDCQQPAASDAGAWAVVSANMILDAHNCIWLMQYPHETLAGGSMFAFHLPDPIPAAGSADGPPVRSAYHQFVGDSDDIRLTFSNFTHHSETLPTSMAQMQAIFAPASATPPVNAPPPSSAK
jgi:hypothetical protein